MLQMQMTMWLVSCSIGRLMVALFEPLGVRHRKQWNNDVQFQIDFQTNQKEKMLEGFQSSPLQKNVVKQSIQCWKNSANYQRKSNSHTNNSTLFKQFNKNEEKRKIVGNAFLFGRKTNNFDSINRKATKNKNNTKVRFRCKKGQM